MKLTNFKLPYPKLIVASIGTAGFLTPVILGLLAISKNGSLERQAEETKSLNINLSKELKDLEEDKKIWLNFGNTQATIAQGLTAQVERLSRELDDEILKNNRLELKRQACAEKGIYYTIRGYRWVLDRESFNAYCK